MNKTMRLLAAGIFALAGWTQSPAATINLFEHAFNIDGTVTSGSAPAGVTVTGFDTTTGLGIISVTLTGAGSHYVGLFVDHEIDEQENTFFNEIGSVVGTPGAGLSWEIDEPGYLFGDIYNNFLAGSLDGTIGTPDPEDVSMAIAWDFVLAANETAVVNFVLSIEQPTGFFLRQSDPDGLVEPMTIYFGSVLKIEGGGGPSGIPEPGVLLLVATGLLAVGRFRRARRAP